MLVAAANGHFEVAQVLLEYGSNIYDTDQAERNLVFVAAMEGHANFLNAILQRADVASLVNECDQYQEFVLKITSMPKYVDLFSSNYKEHSSSFSCQKWSS